MPPRLWTVFILGCGRSGTTVLGQMLSKHRDVTYLNDQFSLWADAAPEYDICGKAPLPGPGKPAPVALDARDAGPVRERVLAALEQRRAGRRVLIEKLAVNNFRIPFLLALAPDAYLISIVRHGVEVAASIEQRALRSKWYGPNDRKWECLSEHARRAGYGALLPLCTSFFYRGLLEWRMSVDAAFASLSTLCPPRLIEVRYEDLVENPVSVCGRLEKFLGIMERPVMREFAATRIARRSEPASEREIPEHTERIAGAALRRLGYWPSLEEVPA
ncbi:MAG: sulfotransferase [Phycisphaerales bacterium]|nr:sulfotransferase [Phycisphaerales bacterium]